MLPPSDTAYLTERAISTFDLLGSEHDLRALARLSFAGTVRLFSILTSCCGLVPGILTLHPICGGSTPRSAVRTESAYLPRKAGSPIWAAVGSGGRDIFPLESGDRGLMALKVFSALVRRELERSVSGDVA